MYFRDASFAANQDMYLELRFCLAGISITRMNAGQIEPFVWRGLAHQRELVD